MQRTRRSKSTLTNTNKNKRHPMFVAGFGSAQKFCIFKVGRVRSIHDLGQIFIDCTSLRQKKLLLLLFISFTFFCVAFMFCELYSHNNKINLIKLTTLTFYKKGDSKIVITVEGELLTKKCTVTEMHF